MTNTRLPKAFTIEYSGIADALVTKCGILCESYNPASQKDVQYSLSSKFNALWDTGAMRSVVSKNVVNFLKLPPIGKATVFHANGESVVNTYLVDIILPNDVLFPSLIVTDGILGDTDVLIGMDIISRGDFTVTASQGKTKFSFQVPSTHDTDYVKDYDQKIRMPVAKEKEPNRNDPCPCGSGKKYKKCCGQ